MKSKLVSRFFALALVAGVHQAVGQAVVINSFSQNGVMVCSGLQTGTVATVEWAPSMSGPWQTNWAGLTGVAVSNNGTITVSVPMFYRVVGVAAPPAGMALIPSGSFQTGDNLDGESDASVHTMYVPAFYMDQTDVTYSLWQQVYNWATTNGYSFDYVGSGKAANHPVQMIDWYDCVKWCNARSEMERKSPAYYMDGTQSVVYRTGDLDIDNSCVNWGAGYRLPTEVEWEKAARGGLSGQRFPWGNTISWSQANYYGDPLALNPYGYAYDLATAIGFDPMFSDGDNYSELPFTSPVGSFAANGYGLFDMSGNILQWCWDWYGTYGSDLRGPSSGSARVFRGGSWYVGSCRSAYRGVSPPARNGLSGGTVGFRSVLSPSQ